MKKTIPWGLTWFMALMLVFSINSWGQGNEDFTNLDLTGSSYADGTFTGQDGSTWTYVQCRGDSDIDGNAIMIGRDRTPQSNFYSGTITGGVGEISFDYMQAFGTNVNLNILINDVVVGNVTSNGEQNIVKTSGIITVDVPGDIVIKFINENNGDGQVVVDNIVWTGFDGEVTQVATPTFSPNGGTFYDDTDVTIETTTENATLFYSTTANDGPWTEYTAPVTVTETTTLYAYATAADLDDSNVASATFDFPTVVDVADVAALRAGATDGTLYRLTAEAILTYQQSFRNQKYIQDATAGIMIDDNGGVITSTYDVYDGITGIIGSLSEYGNMLQFVPAVDPGAATSSANEVAPLVISLEEFNTNFMDYQARLVTIENVSFDVADGTNFDTGTVYDITDGTLTASFRTTFYDADYIGQPVPSGEWNITGLPNSTFDGDFITARNLADFEEYVAPFVEIFQAIPDYFDIVNHTERGFAVDADNIYVASRNGGVFVKVHDRLTGAVTGDLVTTGITGGTFAVNDVEVTADGVILAANMAMNEAGIFKIYQMDAVADPVVLIEYPVTGGRFGDKFTVVGSMSDGSAVIYAADATAAEVVKWTMEADGEGFAFGEPETISIAVAHGNTPVVAPLPDGSFYYTASGQGVSKLNADGTLIGAVSGDLVASSSTAMKYLGTEGTDEFLAIYQNGTGNENVRVVRLINGDPTDAVIEFVTPSMFVNANPNGTGDVAFIPNLTKEPGNVDLYVMGTSNGVGGYTSQILNIEAPVYLPPAEEPIVISTFPWLEGFEDDSETREFWTQIQEVGEADWTFQAGAGGGGITEAYAGALNARFVSQSGDNSPITKLVSPVLDLTTLTDPSLSFFYGQPAWSSDQNETKVYYRISDTDPWVEIAHFTESVTSWTEVVLELPEPSATYQIAFEGINNWGYANVIDNVTVDEAPPVYTVTFAIEDETGTAITDAMVTLDEVTNAEGDYVFADLLPGEYAYSIVAPGFEDTAGTVTIVDQDITVTVVMIEAEEIIALTEFFENFDEVETPDLPEGWSKLIEADNTIANFVTTSLSTPVSEPNHLRIRNGNDATPSMILVGPKVTLFETNWLTFYGRNSTAAQTVDLAVGYITNPNNPASFVEIETLTIEGDEYNKFFVELTGLLDTDEQFLAFQYVPIEESRTTYLDDITWEVAPTTPVLSAMPAALDFSLVDVDDAVTLDLTLQNQGTGTLTIADGDMVLTGTSMDEFSLPADVTYPVELTTGASVTFGITLSPTTVGVKEASIVITHNGDNSPLEIALTGEGLGTLSEFAEDFNAPEPPALPGGWSAIVESTNDNALVETTTQATPFSGPAHVKMQNSGDLEAQLMLVSPKVNNFETNWLTFWAKFSTSAQNDSIVIGYSPDRYDPAQFVPVDKIFVSGNEYTRYTFEFPETMLDTDEFYIVFQPEFTSTFRTFTLDDIAWEEQPTTGVLAFIPEMLEWEGIFINETSDNQSVTLSNFGTADLVIEEANITLTGTDAALFDLVISEDLVFPLTLQPEESFSVEANFSPVTEGTFSANISVEVDGEVYLLPLSGTAVDPTITPNFAFDFIGDFPPENWTRYEGELNDATELTPTTSVWVHGRFGNQSDLPELNAGRINIYGSSRNHWLITPPIDLGDGTTEYMLNFDMALTAWNNSNPSSFGENQYAAVVISTDNGQTWEPANILQMWGPEDEISNTGEGVTIDLTGYTGIVKLGFYGESRAGGGDVDWFVTNVGVREIEFFTATFNVKDSENVDITDATVTLDGQTLTAAPYVFEDLLFGSYDYSVSKTGFIPVEGTVEIVDADVVVDAVLLDAFTVDFTVTSDANPVPLAQIDIYDDADMHVATLETNLTGEASIMLPDGAYTYDVFAIGYDLLEDQSFTIVDTDLSIDVVLTGPEPMALPFVEDFNDNVLPTDWIIVDQADNESATTWTVIDAFGTNSIDETPFAFIDSDDAGSGVLVNSILYTPAIDASVVTGTLTLSFEHYYRHIGNSIAKAEVWNGTEWIELAAYTESTGSWTDPVYAAFDITEHANNQLRVRFHFNDGGSWAWYWAVDNVAIRDLQEYNLTLNVNPEGWGTVTGAGMQLETLPVEVAAIPNEGFAFLNWTDVDGEVVSTEAENVITMPSEDLTLTANFAPGAADPITLNTLLDKIGDNLPPEIGSGGNARSAALFQERYVVVASRENGPNVWVWDSYNPHLDPVALDMGTDIIEPITFPINYVRTTETAIYVSNLSLDPSGDGWGQGVFQIYRWTDLEGTPEVVVSFDALPGRLGDAFSIIGDPEGDGHIVAHINTSKEFRIWNFEGGVLQNEDTPDLFTLDVEFDHINNHGIINPIEGESDIFVLTSNNIGIMIVNLAGEVLAHMDTDVIDMRSYDPNIFYHNGNRYLSYTMNNEANADIAARYQIVDISLGTTVIEAINFISSSEVLADRIVYDKQIADAGHANLTATNQVAFDENGEFMILAHVVGKGFVLETTGALPATYTLTVEAAPAEGGSVSGSGDYYEGATVPVMATPATGYEFVNWTIGADEVSTDAEFNYTMPAEATTLVANFEMIPITEVATLAELRDLPADGTFYRYTGDAVIVAMDGFRNRKFIQDETAAILIDDQPGTITPDYDLYDVITDVVGVLNVHNQLLQFQPRFDTEPATENTPVDPYDFTIDGLTSDDQAKLVKLENVTFTNLEEGQVFANGQNYTITDGENTMTVRTDFWNVDYIGEEIPVVALNITGVIIQFQDNLQIVPRFDADFEEYVAPETFAVTFNVNMSTADGFDPETDVVYMTGSLLGWAEPGTDPDNQTMERVGDTWIWTNTLELEAGAYEYKYFLNAGWDGGEWEGGDNRSLTVDADMTVNDVWGIPETVFELTLVADPAEGGTVAGEGFYEEGAEVLLTAVAADDYVFVDWRDADDVVISTEAEFTFTMPAMAVTLTANFDEDVSVGDFASVDINVFPNPARDNFKITANSTIRSIEIADLAGKVVYNDIINETETSINNNFETGIYLVRILTDEGVFVRKLQIQK